jgi:hypothetical protein
LAHSSKDDVLTDDIYQRLLTLSYIYYTWLDKPELKPSDYINRKMDEGMQSSNFSLPITTSNSIGSKWVKYEIKEQIKKESDLHLIIVPPILTKDCKIPRYLKNK